MNTIQDAIIRLLKKEEFFANCILEMKKVKSTKVPTMGVTFSGSHFVLYYNQDFIEEIKVKERIAVLKHEVHHIVNQHLFNVDNKIKEVWNVATDMAINQYIENLPEGSLYPEIYDLERFKSAEYYYNKIMNDDDLKQKAMADGSRKGGGGKSKGNNNEQDTSNGNGKSGNDSNEGAGNGDIHKEWDEAQGMPKELGEQMTKQMVKSAYEKSIGNIPGEFRGIINSMFESKIPWQKVLRKFMANSVRYGQKSTWKRQNRRFPDDTPGNRPKARHRVLFAQDTSASVGDEVLQMFKAELESLLDTGTEIIEMQFDHDIQKITNIRNKGELSNHEYHGRGGTSFFPIFEWVENSVGKEKFDAVIVLTDGWGLAPEQFNICPTLWVITDYGEKPCHWGEEVKLETGNKSPF